MRKISFFLVFLLMFSLTACYGTGAETTAAETTTPFDTPYCPIFYKFATIEDMETYLTTKSQNEADYSKKPIPFNGMSPDSPAGIIANYPYVSVSRIFSLDESLFESKYIGFSDHDTKNGHVFLYRLDTLYLQVFTLREGDSSVKAEALPDVGEDQIKRDFSGFEILYTVEEGVKREAIFLLGAYTVTIRPAFVMDEAAHPAAYQDFLTNPRTAFLARLFSDDDTVVQSAVDEMLVRLEQTDGTEAAA
ncbi:MAG: hypothetical protein IJY42_05935 [Clostridia bacterium]|nr:hypothetical protein [Clostridia bacterium]